VYNDELANATTTAGKEERIRKKKEKRMYINESYLVVSHARQ